MSFFAKWFKKGKAEDGTEERSGYGGAPNSAETEEAAGNRRAGSPAGSRMRYDADWADIPEERPGTKRLSRYVLLRSPEAAFGGAMQALRGRGAEAEGGVHEGRLIVHEGGMTAVASLIPAPLPGREAEENCKYNLLWPGAEPEIEGYAAHIEVSLLNVADAVAGHKLLTRIIAALLESPNALAVYSAPMVVSRTAYLASADMLEDGLLPVNLWVFVGLYGGGEQGGSSYTHGMQDFGSDELELLNTQRPAGETFELMFSVAAYAIERGIRFQGGETVAFREDQSLTLVRSAGVALEGMTVKVEGF